MEHIHTGLVCTFEAHNSINTFTIKTTSTSKHVLVLNIHRTQLVSQTSASTTNSALQLSTKSMVSQVGASAADTQAVAEAITQPTSVGPLQTGRFELAE